MTYDVIIFTDIADRYYPQRGLGAYKIAHTARQHGYTALVVDFSSVITLTDFKKIIKKIVGDNTKLLDSVIHGILIVCLAVPIT